jgi:hypothetical protein
MIAEMTARARPWGSMNNYEVAQAVRSGERLPLPKSKTASKRAMKFFHKMMLACCEAEEEARPDFGQICGDLKRERVEVVDKMAKEAQSGDSKSQSNSNTLHAPSPTVLESNYARTPVGSPLSTPRISISVTPTEAPSLAPSDGTAEGDTDTETPQRGRSDYVTWDEAIFEKKAEEAARQARKEKKKAKRGTRKETNYGKMPSPSPVRERKAKTGNGSDGEARERSESAYGRNPIVVPKDDTRRKGKKGGNSKESKAKVGKNGLDVEMAEQSPAQTKIQPAKEERPSSPKRTKIRSKKATPPSSSTSDDSAVREVVPDESLSSSDEDSSKSGDDAGPLEGDYSRMPALSPPSVKKGGRSPEPMVTVSSPRDSSESSCDSESSSDTSSDSE